MDADTTSQELSVIENDSTASNLCESANQIDKKSLAISNEVGKSYRESDDSRPEKKEASDMEACDGVSTTQIHENVAKVSPTVCQRGNSTEESSSTSETIENDVNKTAADEKQEEKESCATAGSSSVEVDVAPAGENDEKKMEVEPQIGKRRGRGKLKKGGLGANIPAGRVVEKVLQMKYKRGIKHYLVHWAGTDSASNSWHFFDPGVKGFDEKVKAYDEERKKLNDRGEGASSKKTSRTKHSWYYLSSSEDEVSILKDSFWKDLDDGKLNLFQSPSDLYSGVKEAGRVAKPPSNQEVSAEIPEDYLAETKRLTRSRLQTPTNKKSRRDSPRKADVESVKTDSTETTSVKKEIDGKKKKTPKKASGKAASRKGGDSAGGGKTVAEKKDAAARKKKSTTRVKECDSSRNSVPTDDEDSSSSENEEEEEEDELESEEEDVSRMLVPAGVDKKEAETSKKEDRDSFEPVQELKTDPVDSSKEKPSKKKGRPKKSVDVASTTVAADGKGSDGDLSKEKSHEERMKHLDETIESVIVESRLWYDDRYGGSSDDDDSSSGGDSDDDEGKSGKEARAKKSKKGEKNLKRKKPSSWTSFLESGSKKKKMKLDKFGDEEKEAEDGKEDSCKVDPEAAGVSASEKVVRDDVGIKNQEGSSKMDVEETPVRVETEVQSVEGGAPEPRPPEPRPDEKVADSLEEQRKLDLVRKVSMAIMRGSLEKKPAAPDADKEKQPGRSEESESETGRRRSTDDQKKDQKKIPTSVFNLKLMRPEDINAKKEKLSRTHIDSARSCNVQILMAVKANDVVKVKTMLATVPQMNLEFVDMKTGLSLLWLAVKNSFNTIVTLLVTSGADMERKNKEGLTPLLYAAEKGSFTTVSVLCQLGANLYAVSPDGDTGIMRAMKNRHRNVVQVLLGTGLNLGEGTLGDKSLTQLAKHIGSNEIIEVFNCHKLRLNKELLSRASLCFESSLKIEQPVFPIQTFRCVDSRHFTVYFRHELQPTKKTKGMLLFVGHGQVTPGDVTCSLKGKSQVSKVMLNEHQLHSISDDPNFIFSFSPLLEGVNRLDIFVHPLSHSNYQTHLILCAYSIELSV